MNATPKYPEAVATLTGEDERPFYVIAIARRALRIDRVSPLEIQAFTNDARSERAPLPQIVREWMTVN